MAEFDVSDERHPMNLTADEYERRHRERAERVGDAGLHIIPEQYLRGHDDQDR